MVWPPAGSLRRPAAVLLAAALLAAAEARGDAPAARGGDGAAAAPDGSFCHGEYADSLYVMNAPTRELEASPAGTYTYCIRNTATYEHVLYGADGTLRRQYVRHVRHGTGFAYREQGGEWYVATNEHVAQHPTVTQSDADVEGVPAGSRKVRETVRIVANESDEDGRDPIPLTKVLADEALDLAVLKTSQRLQVMPYRIGSSSALRVGNAVQVRGYPLGAFAAANAGRVIGTGQADREGAWRHEDFAVDALLNAGSSGSPVFAVSCRSGDLELVGVYHAGYKGAQGLNVVVAVDQLRDVLERLRVAPRQRPQVAESDRRDVAERLRAAPKPFVMPFGERAVDVAARGEAVWFRLLDPEYPLATSTQVALVGRAQHGARPDALLLPDRFGDREIPWVAIDAAARDPVQRLFDALWVQLEAVLAYRQRETAPRGGDARAALAATAAEIRSRRAEQKELLQLVDLEADELELPAAAPAASPGSAAGGATFGRD